MIYNKRIKNQHQPTLEEKEIYLQEQSIKQPSNSQLSKIRQAIQGNQNSQVQLTKCPQIKAKGIYGTNRTSPHNPIGSSQFPVMGTKSDELLIPESLRQKNHRFANNPRNFNHSIDNERLENVVDLFRKENHSMYYG